MNQKTEERSLSRRKDDFSCIGLLSAFVLFILFASGCASWQGKAEKEIPCKVAPEDITGLYGAKLTAANTPDRMRMIRLKLSPGFRSELLTDNLDDEPAIIETGQWECKDGLKVTVTLTGRKDLAYEKPQVLVFTFNADSLTAVTYDHGIWGDEVPHLARNPAAAGTVWRLVQIQYANNTAVVPEDPLKYVLILSQDGTVTVHADCNRGMGRYLLAGGSLAMRKLAYTHMICPDNSLFDQYTKALESAESCMVKDGNLFIMLQKDSGVIKFEPADLGQ
jgi:heat shock protein HslJ